MLIYLLRLLQITLLVVFDGIVLFALLLKKMFSPLNLNCSIDTFCAITFNSFSTALYMWHWICQGTKKWKVVDRKHDKKKFKKKFREQLFCPLKIRVRCGTPVFSDQMLPYRSIARMGRWWVAGGKMVSGFCTDIKGFWRARGESSPSVAVNIRVDIRSALDTYTPRPF